MQPGAPINVVTRSGTTGATKTNGTGATSPPKAFGEPRNGFSAVQQFGFAATLFLLFIIYSRIFDAFFAYLHIPTMAFIAVLGAALLAGAFVRPLSHPIGKCLPAFTIWAIITIPFSMYRRGS